MVADADTMGLNKADKTFVTIPEEPANLKTKKRDFFTKVYSILSLQLIVEFIFYIFIAYIHQDQAGITTGIVLVLTSVAFQVLRIYFFNI